MPIFQHGGHLVKDLGSAAAVLGAQEIEWLLLDRFTTDRAAGAVNGTLSEPSGHARTLTDSAPNAVITGGQFKTTAAAAIRDPWLRYATGWARSAGRMLRLDTSANGISGNFWVAGWGNTLVTPDTGVLGLLVTNTAIFSRATPAPQIVSYTLGASVSAYLILRSTGYFILIDGRLRYINRAETTATLYPMAFVRALDASIDVRLDNLGIADLPLTQPTLFPTPTLSDTFSDTVAPLLSDGLAHVEAGGVNGAGLQWNGVGTFSNLGNKAYISPTPGAELLTNGDFAAWTADDPNNWVVTGEAGADPQLCEVATGQSHASCGAPGGGLANFYATAIARPILTQSALVVGNFYRVGVTIDTVVSGGMNVRDGTASFSVTYTTTGVKTSTNRAGHNIFQLQPPGFPVDITVDNATAKLLTFADCLRAVAPASAGEPYVSAKLTITTDTQSGFMINLDSYTNPQYGIHAWYDRDNAKVYARKLVAGVWQADSIAGVAATYSAGAYFEIRRIDDEIYVFYNNTFVATFTAADVPNTNTLVALFATDSASYAESMTSYSTDGYDYSAYQ